MLGTSFHPRAAELASVRPLCSCKMYDKALGYNSVVPEDIREMFMWLCQDVASLHNKWQFYVGLYSGEVDTGLLSELAPGSFSIIEESLRNDMTMSICRLTDPVETTGKPNLSLQTLAKSCEHIDGLSELLDDFLQACDPVRRHSTSSWGIEISIQPSTRKIIRFRALEERRLRRYSILQAEFSTLSTDTSLTRS